MSPLLLVVGISVVLATSGALPLFFADDDVAHALGDYHFGSRQPPMPIVEQSFQMMQDGAHRWSFEAADGTSRWEEAAPAWTDAAAVRGGYGYSSDGGPIAVSYVADEYGFQPTGNAIHPDVMRAVALQVAKAKEEPEGMWDESGFPVFGFHDAYGDY